MDLIILIAGLLGFTVAGWLTVLIGRHVIVDSVNGVFTGLTRRP